MFVKVYMDQATVAWVIPEGKKWEEKEKNGKEEMMKKFPGVHESTSSIRLSLKSKKWFKKVRKRQEKIKKRAKKPPTKAEVYPKLLPS